MTTVITGTKENSTYVSLAVIFPLIEAWITTSNSCLYRKSRQCDGVQITNSISELFYENWRKTCIYVINLVNKKKVNNVMNQTGFHAKTFYQCQMQPVPSEGKQAIVVKRGQKVNDIKRGKNMPLMSSTEKTCP